MESKILKIIYSCDMFCFWQLHQIMQSKYDTKGVDVIVMETN